MAKELLKEDAGISENDYSSYFHFHVKNKGYEFETKDGIKSKLQVWIEHKDFPSVLRNISLGKNKNYIHKDKPGWKNGILKFKQNKKNETE